MEPMWPRMQASCRLARQILSKAISLVQPGQTTADIHDVCHEAIIQAGAYPSPLDYHGFPASVCISVNDVICHGIPSVEHVVQEGDVVSVDVTVYLAGVHGDTCATVVCPPRAHLEQRHRYHHPNYHLVECARQAFLHGLTKIRVGAPLTVISEAIEHYAGKQGCHVIPQICGHGIGPEFHMEPTIWHCQPHPDQVFDPGTDPRQICFRENMFFTVEPAIALHPVDIQVDSVDGQVRTVDGSVTAQFEHTVGIASDGSVHILTG